jgi:hypothetical protein
MARVLIFGVARRGAVDGGRQKASRLGRNPDAVIRLRRHDCALELGDMSPSSKR